jgi:hypothetical protein
MRRIQDQRNRKRVASLWRIGLGLSGAAACFREVRKSGNRCQVLALKSEAEQIAVDASNGRGVLELHEV